MPETEGDAAAGAVGSQGSRAQASAAESEGRPTSPARLAQGRDAPRSNGGGLEGPGSGEPDVCTAARPKQAGPELQPADGIRPTLERGREEASRGGRGPNGAPETQARQEGEQVFRATSNLGLAISQTCPRSSAAYTFSSVAQVQVEENVIPERPSEEGSSGQPGTPLRGKVYNYYVQSVSQSVLKERPSHAPRGTQPLHDLSTIGLPNDPEGQFCQKPAHSSPAADEDRPALEAMAATPSGPPIKPGDEQTVEPEAWETEGAGAKAPQKPPETGRVFSRKESFHKIVENPELQVQMEGFGSRDSSSASRGTPPHSPLRASSVASLVESMQSLQTDTREGPTVEFVAGAKFFQVPLSPEASVNVHLDLGNCYEVLCMAKKQKLDGLREAAYKVMSNNYLQVLRTHAIYGRLNAMERDQILQRRMRGKKYMTVADVSSQEHGQQASRVCYYDDQTDTWHPLTHMPMEAVSRGCAMCGMFNYLFVVAGCEGRGKHQKPSKRVFCYNPLTSIWREICPLNQARPQCKLVALDGYLYAIGGECLYTVERYDPRMDRWTFASPLPNDTFAVAHTATVCDGEIYVTGGTLRYMLLKYISRTDTWKVTLTSGGKDRTTEMVTANGFIYRFDLNRSMGISVYRCSAKAKLWYECANNPMPFPACFQCTVVDNLVYCIGRLFNIRFLADYVSPRFGTKELQNFPSPRGTLFPITLVLPDKEAVQTRV
ncbi:kelch domain-containing protein 7A [Hemicordylus capensis]|uniref:kelch domain-containing protein 7A n=1 Tax=Hemicordylus capensis TaxID=884348 RepID=UPI0023041756|nr:kelch domain-containing protein 7A [Hemicordylus capensis]